MLRKVIAFPIACALWTVMKVDQVINRNSRQLYVAVFDRGPDGFPSLQQIFLYRSIEEADRAFRDKVTAGERLVIMADARTQLVVTKYDPNRRWSSPYFRIDEWARGD